jgi:hypothetical protein
MTRWQYAQITYEQPTRQWIALGDEVRPASTAIEVLNALGANGWELLPIKLGVGFVLRREAPAEEPAPAAAYVRPERFTSGGSQ